MNFVNEIKEELQRYKYQIIGMAMIILSAILQFFGETGIAFGMLAAVLGLDFYLIRKKHDTITKWMRRQFPGWGDKIVMVILLVALTHFAGWAEAFYFVLGTINGHLFWDK